MDRAMNADALSFLGGFLVGSFTVFLSTALYIWKPRLEELLLDRDLWRDRALEAEDNALAENRDDVKVLSNQEWGDPMDFFRDE